MAHGGGRKSARRDPAKESFWRQRVLDQASSGLSVRAFCRRHDLKEVAFYWWRRELARRDKEQVEVSDDGIADRAVKRQPSAFVPVHVTDAPARGGDARIEIVLTDGRCVRVTGSVDRQALSDVLAVLTSFAPSTVSSGPSHIETNGSAVLGCRAC